MIGEFEFLVLAAAARLEPDAYGAAIADDVARVTGRECSSGALYVTLDRLEAKGLVKTRQAPGTEVRAGRRRRMVALTDAGRAAAKEFQTTIQRAARGVDFSKVVAQ
jgi:PadR family transcriptional regulator, regulatory protein PadR